MQIFAKTIMPAVIAAGFACNALALDFPNFHTGKLRLNGSAARISTSDGRVLRITGANTGTAFTRTVVGTAGFSTFFKFRITNPGGSYGDCNPKPGADGFVFVIQPLASTVMGSAGGDLGFAGISPSVGVEFDTWCNGGTDASSNHLAIDLNGSVNHDENSAYADITTADLDDGKIWYAWADYDGKILEVRIGQDRIRPALPTLSQTLDIPALLGATEAFVGFTASTGGDWENFDILSWSYQPDFLPIGDAPAQVGGTIGRMMGYDVICVNHVTTDPRHTLAVMKNVPVSDWSCQAKGMTAAQGDRVSMTITGIVSDSSEPLAGSVVRLGRYDLFCNNLTATTNNRVVVKGLTKPEWNCESAGLQVQAGDQVKIVIRGNVAR